MPRAFHLSAVLVALLLSAPAWAQLDGKPPDASMRTPDALLDGSEHDRKAQLSVFGVYGYGYGFGGAARYTLPILKDGFLPELNDSFEVEGGGDIEFPLAPINPLLIVLAVEPRWTFHFTPQLDAFAKVGVGVFIPIGPASFTLSPVNVLASIGAQYKLTSNLWIRAEASNFVVSLGAGLDI